VAPHSDERDPHPDEASGLADLGRGDPGFGQQVRPQKVGERPGVDGIVLHPAGGDRPGRERVGHMGRDPGIGEEVGEPAPPVRRLEDDLERLGFELAKDPPKRAWLVREASLQDDAPGLVEGDDVGELAVQVDAEVHHGLGLHLIAWSFPAPTEHGVSIGAEARSFMASDSLSSWGCQIH
jgi:hypothetical protein